MEAAKAAALGFVDQQPATVEIGVVAFSDGGFSVQPPTNDKQVVLDAINRLRPQRGTSLGQGIIASLNTIATAAGETVVSNFADPNQPAPTPFAPGTYSSAVIILLSDGENNQNPDPLAAAQAAAERGVRIYTVGIGSPQGAVIQIDDFLVNTRLDEAMLQQISLITDGAYYAAGDEAELQAIYEDIDLKLVVESEQMEVTSIFAGISMLFMLVAGTISLLWFSRWP
jgi:Ca-activated chloride channel family protein